MRVQTLLEQLFALDSKQINREFLLFGQHFVEDFVLGWFRFPLLDFAPRSRFIRL